MAGEQDALQLWVGRSPGEAAQVNKQTKLLSRVIRKIKTGEQLNRHERRAIRKAKRMPPGRGYQGGKPRGPERLG